MNEFELIANYFQQQANQRDDVILGIGDDAAIFAPKPNYECVITTDTLVNGVHFPLNTCAKSLGHKSLAVNLSDLAAMAAEPAVALLSLTIPYINEQWLADFAQGFNTLLQQFNMQLIGGDTCQGNLAITCQVIGYTPKGKAIKRSGAQIGDGVYVSGQLGAAGAYLQQLKGRESTKVGDQQALCYPVPQVALGMALRDIATSMIDISDGLASDLQHILKASDCGATIELEKLPIAASLQTLPQEKQYHYALAAGDEYQLLFTAPKQHSVTLERADVTQIGEITQEKSLQLTVNGQPRSLNQYTGYQHFNG